MTPVSKVLWVLLVLMGSALLLIGRQHSAPPVVQSTASSQDVQDVIHQEQVALAEKQTEIHGLEMQLQDERTMSSRSIDLMQIDPEDWHTGWTATWYAEGGINGDGITATGKRTEEQWTIAVDPCEIPLGSLVEVKFGNGVTRVYQALDTGGAVLGKHIDIYDPNVAQCFKNGRQPVEIRILERGK